MASTLTRERLIELVHYDPETGVFTWAAPRPHCRVGDRVGTLRDDGYLKCVILGVQYLLHRLAWFYMTGEWPAGLIDHRNRKKADNRWRNLREATNGQNLTNSNLIRSSSGFRGVHLYRQRDGRPRYTAHISLRGATAYLGTFDTPEEAHAAYVRVAQATHGEFAEHL